LGVRQQKNHALGLAERVRAEDNTDSGNTLQIKTLFALSNLWMVRHKLMGAQA